MGVGFMVFIPVVICSSFMKMDLQMAKDHVCVHVLTSKMNEKFQRYIVKKLSPGGSL